MSISPPQIETHREPAGAATAVAVRQGRPTWIRMVQALFFCAARFAFAAFLLLTSIYCLLVWVPFSYFGFIRNPLVSWLPVFVRLHGAIYGIVLSAVAVTLIPDLRRRESRRAAAAMLACNACAVIYVWTTGPLVSLQPELKSYLWSMLCLFPLVWLAALDFSGKEGWALPVGRAGVDLQQTTLAAIIVSVAFAAASTLRQAMQGNVPGGFALRSFGASLCFHLAIFTAVGLILVFIEWATRSTSRPEVLYFVLTRVFAWWMIVAALRTMILPTISFEGTQASIFAAVVSFVLVFSASGFAVRLRTLNSEAGLVMPRVARARWMLGVPVLGLLTAAYGIPVLIGHADWDFVLQRTAVIAVWICVLQLVIQSGVRIRGRAATVAVYLVLTAAAAGFVRYAKLTLYNPDPPAEWRGVLDAYAGADISLKTAYSVLSRPVDNKAYRQFYEFLKQNTNLGRDTAVGPADVRLVADLEPVPGSKPNIFLFVIDSLRQDYVSAYNPAVDFTTAIGRFARDSVVMEKAFTRYGGTALSEPAIWTGAMQLHKQYIQPFYPMNNLQKLLEMDGYQSYISVDPILRMMLKPSTSITELDKNSSWADLDFVPTLRELETKIDSRSDPKKPIFAYTQPQNVHTLNLERSKIKGGRKEVSIYELRRIDAAFGEFISFLRQRGLYGNSIIIVTADHGDSYGEYGRYGHSDFLFPEIIRIPLIVHLPQRMREQFVWDSQQAAFTTDITPSLYYLLGHRPILKNELFGRPLFTQTQQEQTANAQSQYLIVSSYAPVYAMLGGKGQSLFIVDAVNSRNYYYNLIEDPLGTRNNVTIQIQNENEALIRRVVGQIDDFYGWHPDLGAQ